MNDPRETIGRCEQCGLVDHHLIEGECPKCRDKTTTIDATKKYTGYTVGHPHPNTH